MEDEVMQIALLQAFPHAQIYAKEILTYLILFLQLKRLNKVGPNCKCLLSILF